MGNGTCGATRIVRGCSSTRSVPASGHVGHSRRRSGRSTWTTSAAAKLADPLSLDPRHGERQLQCYAFRPSPRPLSSLRGPTGSQPPLFGRATRLGVRAERCELRVVSKLSN